MGLSSLHRLLARRGAQSVQRLLQLGLRPEEQRLQPVDPKVRQLALAQQLAVLQLLDARRMRPLKRHEEVGSSSLLLHRYVLPTEGC